MVQWTAVRQNLIYKIYRMREREQKWLSHSHPLCDTAMRTVMKRARGRKKESTGEPFAMRGVVLGMEGWLEKFIVVRHV